MKYKVNGKVLAYHGPLIYEAKVLKSHEAGKNYILDNESRHVPITSENYKAGMDDEAYFLHYKGWKSKWDEWVIEDRILEYNNENWEMSKVLRSEYNARTRNKTVPTTTTTTTATASATAAAATASKPKTKVKRKLGEDKDRLKKKKLDIILPISNELKYLLVDDWEFITRNNQVVTLPSKIPISRILQDYLEFSETRPESDLNIIKEVIAGLEAYFNESIKVFVLYKYERLQYSNLLKEYKDMKMTDIYGLEHLLRLFISLPGLIAQTTMDGPSIQVMIDQCQIFLKYLSKTYDRYINEYQNTSPAYDNLARS